MRYETRPDSVGADPGPRGRLTPHEFTRLLSERDPEMSAEDCENAFDEIDTDRDGLIDSAQFLTWWNERL